MHECDEHMWLADISQSILQTLKNNSELNNAGRIYILALTLAEVIAVSPDPPTVLGHISSLLEKLVESFILEDKEEVIQ